MTDYDEFIYDSGDEDVMTLTPAEVFHRMKIAWMNEKLSPVLLPAQTDLLQLTNELIAQEESDIKNLPVTDLRRTLKKMMLERIRYVQCNYLRCRLHKIEDQGEWVLMEARDPARSGDQLLTPEEFRFAKNFVSSLTEHYQQTCMQRMVPTLRKIEPHMLGHKANQDAYVFFRVVKTFEGLLVEEGIGNERSTISINVCEGEQHFMRFRTVANLVENGTVHLI